MSQHVTESAHGRLQQRGNRSVAVLALSVPMLVSILPLAIAPGLQLMAAEFGDTTAQLVLTLPAMVMILGAGVCGYLAERWGRRMVIVAALLLYAAGGIVGFFAANLASLAASRVASGFASGILLTSIYAVIGEYYEGNRRERLLGFMTMASALSSVIALAFIGLVVELFGWRAPFLFYAAGILLVPFALGGLHKGGAPVRLMKLTWSPVLESGPIYLLLAAYAVGMFMLVIQGPLLLGEKGITSPSTIGRLIAISSATAGVIAGVYGLLRRVFAFREMLVLISAVLAVGLPLAAWAPGAPMFAVSALVLGIAMGTVEPTIVSELLLRTPEPLHDRAMGVNVAALFAGQFLNPLAVAPLRQIGGYSFAFQLFGAAYTIAGVLFLMSIINEKRSIAARARNSA